jgi:hypothetical protein
MDIEREAVNDLYYGHQTAGVVARRLVERSCPCLKGVLLRTPNTTDPVPNTACVWVGDSRVKANSDEDRGGMPIPAGEALFLPVSNANRLWVISTADNQDVAWMGM